MLPSDQRFEQRDPTVVAPDDRLEVQEQLVVVDRGVDLGPELQAR
jgi:hypothetical protein